MLVSGVGTEDWSDFVPDGIFLGSTPLGASSGGTVLGFSILNDGTVVGSDGVVLSCAASDASTKEIDLEFAGLDTATFLCLTFGCAALPGTALDGGIVDVDVFSDAASIVTPPSSLNVTKFASPVASFSARLLMRSLYLRKLHCDKDSVPFTHFLPGLFFFGRATSF